VTAGSWSSDHLTDGVVKDHVLASLGGTPELAGELVAEGLWRRIRGGYKFHDWLDKNPSKEAVEKQRKTNVRRQALFRDGALKQAIRGRDRDTCRYCGIRVRWGKGQAPDSGTYDHVDPEGSNTLQNLVVACLACNSRKRDRTPAEAGMTLLNATPDEGSRKASTEAPSQPSAEALPTRPGTYTGLSNGSPPLRARDPSTSSLAARHPSAKTVAEALRRPE
jgi:5-methylcytosine-specific restriction endonuclease McrA